MAEEFDRSAAADRQMAIVREAQRIRDGITDDVINYYYDRLPDSEEEEREYRAGLRKYLRIAADRINSLLDRLS